MSKEQTGSSGAVTRLDRRLAEFESVCRARGLPVTVQRRTIIEAVLESAEHPSAEEVYLRVKDRLTNVSRSTVYRALETMVGLGALRRLNHSGVAVRYDPRLSRHHHLVCSRCNKVLDYENQSLDVLPLPRTGLDGFQIDDFSVHFAGICAECAALGQRQAKRP